jgi:hypothetical protein
MVVDSFVPLSLFADAQPVRNDAPPTKDPAAVIPESFKKSLRETGM